MKMSKLTVKTDRNPWDGTFCLYLMDGEKIMYTKNQLEESDIFPATVEAIEIAKSYGYEVEV